MIKRIIISIVLTFFTLFIPVKITDLEQLEKVYFGLPVHFIEQDLSKLTPPTPYYVSLSNFYEYPTKFNFINFIISFLIVYILLVIITVLKNFFKKNN